MGVARVQIYFFSIMTLILTSCATGHCVGSRNKKEDMVMIFKADQSTQCSKKPNGISLEKMAEELGGIQIFSQENKNDGMMHMTLCGSPTGRINVYQIHKNDLDNQTDELWDRLIELYFIS